MNKEIESIIAKLPPEDQKVMTEHLEVLEENSRGAAMAAIMARNFSHNVGQYIFQVCAH